MSWEISYEVRPADPSDRRDHPDAYEVRMLANGMAIRVAGIWKTERAATEIAAALNNRAGEQIR